MVWHQLLFSVRLHISMFSFVLRLFDLGKPSHRYALTSLGAGWGIGSAWTLNSLDFAKEKKCNEFAIKQNENAPKA